MLQGKCGAGAAEEGGGAVPLAGRHRQTGGGEDQQRSAALLPTGLLCTCYVIKSNIFMSRRVCTQALVLCPESHRISQCASMSVFCVIQEQLRSIKKELGLEKDDKSALIQKYARAPSGQSSVLLSAKHIPSMVTTDVNCINLIASQYSS
jgi:hypothetical protein